MNNHWSVDLEYSPTFLRAVRGTAGQPAVLLHKIGSASVEYNNGWWTVTYKGSGIRSRQLYVALMRMRALYPKRVTGEAPIGYRCWGLVGDCLVPLTRPHDVETWAGPVAHAEIVFDEMSGLHAVKPDPTGMQHLAYEYAGHAVRGFVEIRGTIKEYERGYRCSEMVILFLHVHPAVSDGFIQLLENRYQCEVKRWKAEIDD